MRDALMRRPLRAQTPNRDAVADLELHQVLADLERTVVGLPGLGDQISMVGGGIRSLARNTRWV